MIEMRGLKNFVIFIQTILSFVLSRIIDDYCMAYQKNHVKNNNDQTFNQQRPNQLKCGDYSVVFSMRADGDEQYINYC